MEPDVQCTNCTADLRPENALMRNGKPFWTQQTAEIVCPFCGFEYEESYKFIDKPLVRCIECGARFELDTFETVVYTTRKPDWLQQWKAYNSNQIFEVEYRNIVKRAMKGD